MNVWNIFFKKKADYIFMLRNPVPHEYLQLALFLHFKPQPLTYQCKAVFSNSFPQIIQPDGKFVDYLGVVTKQQINPSTVWEITTVTCTDFNGPTSVAITNDRIIVLDSGNRRVKVYNKNDKGKILEFGSMGQRKGQFRQAEVLTVDPMGFILVGDSGNCRVQVFKPNGQLVRVFGGMGSEPGKFGWISGIHVTKQLDIIISDTKTRSVNFF